MQASRDQLAGDVHAEKGRIIQGRDRRQGECDKNGVRCGRVYKGMKDGGKKGRCVLMERIGK